LLAADNQSRLFQNAKVLHDPEPRQLGNFSFQLTERHPIALEERVEQEPPGGVGQGLEHQVLVVHAPLYVTYASRVNRVTYWNADQVRRIHRATRLAVRLNPAMVGRPRLGGVAPSWTPR
jgi:hypothetical protein